MNREKGLNIASKIVLCILLAVLSFFILGRYLSAPDTYANIFESIDSKVQSVLKLTASSTAASAGITAIPGDIGTPIAEKLADFSEYGILILCVLYAEKYLLTILGSGVFRYILPAVCILYTLSFFRNFDSLKPILQKIAAVSLALFFVIPLSIHVSDKIYNTYQASIDSTISAAEELAEDTALLSEAGEDQNAIQKVLGVLSESTTSLAERGGEILNRFIESLAVMIVTSCLIPLLVLFFSVWLVNQILGINISVRFPRRRLPTRAKHPSVLPTVTDDPDP
ncbi:MAG: hypothetical protein IKS55_09305 [Oscillospiraceae bacterium]|nr:hypothetical protein [Oscillospiraceae bacterium]